MKILVTAGPTREYIDAVRFISTPSSGKMGFEIAKMAYSKGHDVLLISGPTDLKRPKGVKFVSVASVDDMYKSVSTNWNWCEAVIMTSAVSDFKPAKRHNIKIKRRVGRKLILRLVPTKDIIGEMGKRKGDKILVGFALEVQNPRINAIKKMEMKNLDYIVLNSPRSFGSDRIDATIFDRNGKMLKLGFVTKKSLAAKIIGLVEQTFSS